MLGAEFSASVVLPTCATPVFAAKFHWRVAVRGALPVGNGRTVHVSVFWVGFVDATLQEASLVRYGWPLTVASDLLVEPVKVTTLCRLFVGTFALTGWSGRTSLPMLFFLR